MTAQVDEDANRRTAQGYLNLAATHRLQGQHELADKAVLLAQRYDPSARGGAVMLKAFAPPTAPAIELSVVHPRRAIAIFAGTLIAAVIIATATLVWVWS